MLVFRGVNDVIWKDFVGACAEKKHKAPPPLETMPEEQVEARSGKYGLRIC